MFLHFIENRIIDWFTNCDLSIHSLFSLYDYVLISSYAASFSNSVIQLQDCIHSLNILLNDLEQCKLELRRCDYSHDAFKAIISKIIEVTNKFSYTKCSNLTPFLYDLEVEIGDILKTRMNNALNTWVTAFDRRQRESTCNVMEEKELIENERESVEEVVVYDEVMRIQCNHQVWNVSV